jgi:D-amino-acid oxidase
LVIGAGVSGLTTAVVLAETGQSVQVWTSQPSTETTSCAAGAIWSPYLAADERIVPWAEKTLPKLFELATDPEVTGVRLVHGLEAARSAIPAPDWATRTAGFRLAKAGELPEGFASGWWYTAPVLDMPAYLDFLARRLAELGGRLERRTVQSLREAERAASVVVNCAGMGARVLVPDQTLTPIRGQLVVADNPGVHWFFAEHDESPHPTYFLPQGDHIVLGGSAEPGRSDLAVDEETSRAIQQRCAAIEPRLGNVKVRSHRVGLRPTRERVRLERVGQVIHNYGHGGAGVTVSWGCAREVAELIDA